MSDVSYRRVTIQRTNLQSSANDEIDQELKNDLQLAFNLYKNDENKINKLKLRTILFSFVWYKSSAKNINEFISEIFPNKEEFTFENLVKLVNKRIKISKEKEADDLFNYINGGKGTNTITETELFNAFQANQLELSDKEAHEMINFIQSEFGDNTQTTRDEFKKFYS
jgi:hypothetical protein